MKAALWWVLPLALVFGCAVAGTAPLKQEAKAEPIFKVVKSDADWKKALSPQAYDVLRHAGTERPYSGKYWDNHADGLYVCAGCKQEIFTSGTKFESGTGWPSFWQPIRKKAVLEHKDNAFGMQRTEVLCSRCGGHLGHVFDDGPEPTGLRYCMNSVAMVFKPAKKP